MSSTAQGSPRTSVVPVLVERAHFDAPADAHVLAGLMQQKAHGGADWLFVGQIGAHKAQHDVIKAFSCYRSVYDPQARLHLVGREMGSAYRDALVRFVHRLGLDDAVQFTGSIPVGALAAHYAAADIFVCCSDHEGFCIPLIEAMSHGVPVVAYGAAAVTETVAHAGVVLAEKQPLLVASAVAEILGDKDSRDELVALGKAQASRYTVDNAEKAFRETIEAALALD